MEVFWAVLGVSGAFGRIQDPPNDEPEIVSSAGADCESLFWGPRNCESLFLGREIVSHYFEKIVKKSSRAGK